jgi:nitrate/TMAO reductase-like tetraheme cytochrome c subunit
LPVVPVATAALRTFTESRECAECHREIYDEWLKDQHSTAWSEEKFERFTEKYTRVECLSCHAPEPMLQVGVKSEPKLRETHRAEGVDCLSCHVKDGRTFGTLGSNAPCGGTKEQTLATAEACYHCHSAHNLYKEFLASDHYKRGMTCQDCHMEKVERAVATGGPVRKTRKHFFHAGAHDLEAVKKSLELGLAVENKELVVTITNVGAAHGVPGEVNNRVMRLELSLQAPNKETGAMEEQRAYRETFRPPPRFMRDKIKSSQIMPGEPRVLRYPLPAESGRVEALMTFKLEHDSPESTVVELMKKEMKY